LYAYSQNGGGKGFDFIQNFVVLGWVVSIRWLLGFIPVVILFYGVGSAIGIVGENTNLFSVVFFFLSQLVLVERIGRHIGDTRNTEGEQAAGPQI